jgi:holo-[acyl-carrier protein] synthase
MSDVAFHPGPPAVDATCVPTTVDAGRLALDALSQALGGVAPVPSARSGQLVVGVDVVEVADIAHSVATFGDRYVHRIFTPHEIDCCRRPAGYADESLAARFAAKEAVIKVLRPEGPRPEWRSIEVHRTDSGWCGLRLSGLAAVLADQAGIEQLAVSLTHEASWGAAVVVATVTGEHHEYPHHHDQYDEDHPNTGEATGPPPFPLRKG